MRSEGLWSYHYWYRKFHDPRDNTRCNCYTIGREILVIQWLHPYFPLILFLEQTNCRGSTVSRWRDGVMTWFRVKIVMSKIMKVIQILIKIIKHRGVGVVLFIILYQRYDRPYYGFFIKTGTNCNSFKCGFNQSVWWTELPAKTVQGKIENWSQTLR